MTAHDHLSATLQLVRNRRNAAQRAGRLDHRLVPRGEGRRTRLELLRWMESQLVELKARLEVERERES